MSSHLTIDEAVRRVVSRMQSDRYGNWDKIPEQHLANVVAKVISEYNEILNQQDVTWIRRATTKSFTDVKLESQGNIWFGK